MDSFEYLPMLFGVASLAPGQSTLDSSSDRDFTMTGMGKNNLYQGPTKRHISLNTLHSYFVAQRIKTNLQYILCCIHQSVNKQ